MNRKAEGIVMDREEAINELKQWQAHDDTEIEHLRADEVLCDLLISLGYQDVVDEWKEVGKWYA